MRSEKPQRAEVETINSKSFLCIVDGIQVVIGDNTVTVEEGDCLVAKFSVSNGKKGVVEVKKDLIKKYAEDPWERCEECAYEVMRSKDEKLFEWVENLSLKK